MLSLLFLAGTLQTHAFQKHHKTKKNFVEHTMTVAGIRPAEHSETFITVFFLESARFYKLPKNAKPVYLELLKESERQHSPVLVKRAKEESDEILSVKKP